MDSFSYRTKKYFLRVNQKSKQAHVTLIQHGLSYENTSKRFRIAFVHNLYNASSLEKEIIPSAYRVAQKIDMSLLFRENGNGENSG